VERARSARHALGFDQRGAQRLDVRPQPGQNSARGNDEGRSVALDANGNTFISGTYYFSDGASDTPAAARATSISPSCRRRAPRPWQQTIGSAGGDDRASAIAHRLGRQRLCHGQFQGTVDFDAGAGVSKPQREAIRRRPFLS
jgi:hypothetical protein